MGYYVYIQESTFQIPVENLEKAYDAMCQLNFTVPNSQKRGGSWPGKDQAPQFGPHPDSWFSWIDWNYHETCKNAGEILDQLGFEIEYDDNGNLRITAYDSKTGQEPEFLKAISPFAKGYIVWKGECDEIWGETYGGKEVIVKYRTTPVDYSDIVTV